MQILIKILLTLFYSIKYTEITESTAMLKCSTVYANCNKQCSLKVHLSMHTGLPHTLKYLHISEKSTAKSEK